MVVAAVEKPVVTQQCRKFSVNTYSHISLSFSFFFAPFTPTPHVSNIDHHVFHSIFPDIGELLQLAFVSYFSANKIVISNVPSGVRFDQLEQILLQFGQVKEIEKLSQRDGPMQVIQIAFESAEQAHK